MWCDVRLTKDGDGICLPSINMDNCTMIDNVFPEGKKTYNVNGVSTVGWFSVDYTSTDLLPNVTRKCSYKFVLHCGLQHFDIVNCDGILYMYGKKHVQISVP
jgi:hypothetical protein